jgi:hypothetical protein
MKLTFTFETCLYVAIAVLGAAQMYIKDGLIPKAWEVPVGLTLIGATCLKAKLSTGLRPDNPNESGDSSK